METIMKYFMLLTVLVFSLVMTAGCNHHQAAKVNDPEPVKQSKQVSKTTPTNPNNILLNVKKGMTPTQVRNLIGNPERQNVYPTGKQFIPYYVGPDFHRMDWFYGNYGHVTFSINRFSNYKQVLKVHYK